MNIEPYLFFNGRCEEAIDFYKKALGAEVDMLMRFKDSPEPPKEGCGPPPGSADKIMHTSFRVGDTEIMASDGHCTGKPNFQGFGLAHSVASEAEADRVFAALGEGGQVMAPLAKTFFSPRFGMLTDRFGIMWMIMVTPKT